MDLRVLQIALLLSGSGMCALIYQTAWLRELRLIFGASTPASAAVLAIFMGGLGLGGLLLGRRAEAHPRPLKFYAHLELLIAASTAATPLLLWLARVLYVALGGTVVMGSFLGTCVRLLLSAMVLAVPTLLMGGTLPAAARAVETETDARRRNMAVLYGLNTLGAVLGASLSTFLLLERLGTRGTLLLACAVNVCVALLARSWSADMPALTESPAPASPPPPSSTSQPESTALPPLAFVLGACAMVGFAFLLMELTWYRMLGPLLGGSTFTFGLILAVALFGIGLGGVAYALWGEGRPATVRGFALTCILEALFIIIPYALGDRLALFALFLRPLTYLGFGGAILSWTLVTTVVVLPAAFISGIQFPMLIALLGHGRHQVGRQVGLGYAWNTIGAIVGSLAGGFGLLPLLGALGTWRLCSGLLLALGLAAVFLSLRGHKESGFSLRDALPLLFSLVTLQQIMQPGPSAVWRHSGIGAGRSDYAIGLTTFRDFLNAKKRAIAWEVEGVETSVALANDDGNAFIVSGKVDGNARGDAHTFVMGGLLGAILHPHPQQSMVIGLGTGETTGWIAAVPEMTRIDSVEIEPSILRVARDCALANQKVMDNPKVHHIIGDARELLLTTRSQYDVILSQPSNPYRAGIASLYTVEYYASALKRMAPGGLFLQWVQAYEVDNRTIRTVYATLGAVFPSVETWMTDNGDLLLIGSRDPIAYDIPTLRARLQQEPYKTAMQRVFRATSLEALLAHYVARPTLAKALAQAAQAEINTDDANGVEFGFARSVGRQSNNAQFQLSELWQLARTRGEDRPPVSGGSFDWNRFEDRRITMYAIMKSDPPRLPHYTEAQVRLGTAVQAFLDGNPSYAASAYVGFLKGRHPDPPAPAPAPAVTPAPAPANKGAPAPNNKGPAAPAPAAPPAPVPASPAPPPIPEIQPEEPLELSELTLLAEGMAELRDPAVVGVVAKLRPIQPVEADIILARFYLQTGQRDQALASLIAAFEGYRQDPWPSRLLMQRGLRMVDAIMGGAPPENSTMAAKLYAALQQPFAISALNEERQRALVKLAGLTPRCVEAFAPFEPHMVWQRSYLVPRLNCYRLHGSPLRQKAEQELMEFLVDEPTPLASTLVP